MLHGDGRALEAMFKRTMENNRYTITVTAAATWLLQLFIEICLSVGRTDRQTNTYVHYCIVHTLYTAYKRIAIEYV